MLLLSPSGISTSTLLPVSVPEISYSIKIYLVVRDGIGDYRAPTVFLYDANDYASSEATFTYQ